MGGDRKLTRVFSPSKGRGHETAEHLTGFSLKQISSGQRPLTRTRDCTKLASSKLMMTPWSNAEDDAEATTRSDERG
jgi:hypothetical protein